MVTTVSERGMFMIAAHEGIVPTRYRDLAGVDTFGIGHTSAAGRPIVEEMPFKMPRTDAAMDKALAAAISVFERDVAKYEEDVVSVVGNHLPQHVFDAVVSWHYNTGGIWSSRATDYLKEGRYSAAASVIRKWNKVTVQGRKRVSEALKKRREQETRLLVTSHYPDTIRLPVWGTNGKGRVIWKDIDSLTFAEFVRVLEDRKGQVQVTKDRTTPTDDRDDAGPVAGMIAAAIAFVAVTAGAITGKIQEVFQWLF